MTLKESSYQWRWKFLQLANLVDNSQMVLSKQNTTGTVYNYYRNQPEALVDMFDDTRYPDLSSWEQYDCQIQHTDHCPDKANNKICKQAGTPTFSIEYLSSTNGDNAKNPKSLIGQLTNNQDMNKHGGTFDGLSVLEHDDFVHFLNSAAAKIAKTNNVQPENIDCKFMNSNFYHCPGSSPALQIHGQMSDSLLMVAMK